MDWIIPSADDWAHIFLPSTSLLEIVIRGSVVYLVLFFGLRFLLKREAAGLGIADLLVVVLLADAVQNGMADDYRSVTDGLLLAAVVMGWAWLLAFIAYHFPRARGLIHPSPILLIKRGRLIRSSAERELLEHEEIMGQLRQQGIARIEDVDEAYIETNGVITAIPRDRPGQQKGNSRQPGV